MHSGEVAGSAFSFGHLGKARIVSVSAVGRSISSVVAPHQSCHVISGGVNGSSFTRLSVTGNIACMCNPMDAASRARNAQRHDAV